MKIEHLETILAVYRCQSLKKQQISFPVPVRPLQNISSMWKKNFKMDFLVQICYSKFVFYLTFYFFRQSPDFPYTKRGKMNICNSVIKTAVVCGFESLPVKVETDVSDGMPSFDMVGFLTSEVKEARERVRTA